jgi:dolichol-phosphate mannosyltransferase
MRLISLPIMKYTTEKEVPAFTIAFTNKKTKDHAVIIPVLNEGERLINQLNGMASQDLGVDIIIIDGGSNDGSTGAEILQKHGVHTKLVTNKGLSSQMRAGFDYALNQGYLGVVSIDGNGKDSWSDIPTFVELLKSGYGYVQGSRYIKGGVAINTPKDRERAVKYIHAPIISLGAGFKYTDTTNGFRAYSRNLLVDNRVNPFRNIFETYNLHYYLAVRAARLGYKVIETPVTRQYPSSGKVPTKISGIKGKISIIKQMLLASIGYYNPR